VGHVVDGVVGHHDVGRRHGPGVVGPPALEVARLHAPLVGGGAERLEHLPADVHARDEGGRRGPRQAARPAPHAHVDHRPTVAHPRNLTAQARTTIVPARRSWMPRCSGSATSTARRSTAMAHPTTWTWKASAGRTHRSTARFQPGTRPSPNPTTRVPTMALP